MSVSILVATPFAAFGELIRISLEDNGQYAVRLVDSGREAKEAASRDRYQLAILDAALTDVQFLAFCSEILELQKGIKLVVIPPENNVNHPSLGGLMPHGYINRPFYLPDMLDTINRLVINQEMEKLAPQPYSPTLPSWMQDLSQLRDYLQNELGGTEALAGIIGTSGPLPETSALKVWAGEFTEESATELLSTVFRYWNRDEFTDLMRFIRLPEEKMDYLVYATRMTADHILVLAYDTKAPLSHIRQQTKNLAQLISFVPPETNPQAQPQIQPSKPEQLAEEPSPAEFSTRTPEESGWFPEELVQALAGQEHLEDDPIPGKIEPDPTEELRFPLDSNLPPEEPVPARPQVETLDDESIFNRVQNNFAPFVFPEPAPEESKVPNLTDLSGSDSRPDSQLPSGASPSPEKNQKECLSQSNLVMEQPITSPSRTGTAEETQPTSTEVAYNNVQGHHPWVVSQATGRPSPVTDRNLDLSSIVDLFQEPEPPANPLEDTRPHLVASLTNISQLEPVSPALSQLNYTCVLIPRIPQHYLTGELADKLAQWVPQYCLAYGWRLEGIAIRPEYMLWTVQVAPSISPGNLVRIVRQWTSQNIFNQYTNLRDQNPSGDFWASGYLIVSGAQPPSAQLLREYISQTRKRQGVIK